MDEDCDPRALPLTLEELGRLRLFDRVDLEAVRHLLADCPLRRLGAGEVLIQRDAENESLFLIVEGRLRIHLDADEPSIAVLRAGETVGELSVLDRRRASATVIADRDCTLLEFGETLVWLLVHASYEFGRNLLILLAERIRSVNSVVDRTLQLQREYEFHATTDALTGLYNRRWLNDALALEMTRCLSRQQPFSVLMIDVDHFKGYNDEHGHLAGDAALQAVAGALRTVIRDVDMGVRFGGVELMVLVPSAEAPQAERVAERVLQAVRSARPEGPEGESLPAVTVSIGVTEMRGRETSRALLERVDRALYRAKDAGRDRVVVLRE